MICSAKNLSEISRVARFYLHKYLEFKLVRQWLADLLLVKNKWSPHSHMRNFVFAGLFGFLQLHKN